MQTTRSRFLGNLAVKTSKITGIIIVFAVTAGILSANQPFYRSNLTSVPAPDFLRPIGSRIPKPSCCNVTQGVTETQVLVGSYYDLTNGFDTSLMFNNKGPEPLPVSLTFYSLSGAELHVNPITIPAASFLEVNVRTLLEQYQPGFEEGSLHITHVGMRQQLGAQFKILKQGILFEEQFINPASRYPTPKLESVWWKPSLQAETKFIISNTTNAAVTASIEIDGTVPAQNQPTSIELGAHETKILSLLGDILDWPHAGIVKKEGGITIDHNGPAGAIMARMHISKPQKGYSSVIQFSDPTTAVSSKMNAGGLRIGSIGNDKLEPVVVARNIGNIISWVKIKLPYTDANGNVQNINVPKRPVLAGKTASIDLRPYLLLPSSTKFTGIEIEYTTAPGTVLLGAISASQSGKHTYPVPLMDPQRMPSSAGGFPWKVDGNYNTIVYIKNETEVLKRITADLLYPGGKYALGVTEVKAGQTIAIDFKGLRDGQIPDVNNTVIPLSSEKGQIAWSVIGADNRTMSGRSEQVNETLGIASTYACYNCCPNSFSDAWIEAFEYSGGVGGTENFVAMQSESNCFGTPVSTYPVTWASLSSTNPTVADFVGGSLVEAFAPGSATIEGSWETGYYTMEGVGYYECIWVQVYPHPTAPVEVASDITDIFPQKGSVGGKIELTVIGNGFTSSTSISPVAGITFSNLVVNGENSLTAQMLVSGETVGGNHEIKVVSNDTTSNGKNFFVQIPTRARRDSFAPIVIRDPTPGNIVNAGGTIIASNVCGAYRNLEYTLLDQHDNVLLLGDLDKNIGLTVTEVLTGFQSNPPRTPPSPVTSLTNNLGEFYDIVATFTPPPCQDLGVFSFSLNQAFTVKVDSKVFSLTTTNAISVARTGAGQWTIGNTNSIP